MYRRGLFWVETHVLVSLVSVYAICLIFLNSFRFSSLSSSVPINTARGERLKEATVEARRVIDGYREEKEKQFQEFVKTVSFCAHVLIASLVTPLATHCSHSLLPFPQIPLLFLEIRKQRLADGGPGPTDGVGTCQAQVRDIVL